MKRLYLLILLSILIWGSQPSFAQNGHLKFMGIPIDGPVSSFQQKLEAKGMSYDAQTSKSLEAGIRVMDGIFAGYKCEIVLYYTPKTKNMYEVQVLMESSDEETIGSRVREMIELVTSKYDDSFYGLDTVNSIVILKVFPKRYPSDKDFLWTRCYGRIAIYRDDDDDDYYKNYRLRIFYTDQLNDDKNDESKLSDI